MSVDPKTQSLFDAIANANYDRVKQEIDAGASINQPNDDGQTPLAVACRQGRFDIVDLLVTAGAQMQIQSAPILSRSPASDRQIPIECLVNLLDHPDRVDATKIDPDLIESPLHDREISFESLIETIHRPTQNNVTEIESDIPEFSSRDREISFESLIDLIERPVQNNATEIEQIIPIQPQSATKIISPLVPTNLTYNTALHEIAASQHDLHSDEDAEMTYTFDLDEVFNQNELYDQASLTQSELLINSDFVTPIAPRSVNKGESATNFEANETYAFDLSSDLERLTAEANEEPDRLSAPIGTWDEQETYLFDELSSLTSEVQIADNETYVLEGFADLSPAINLTENNTDRVNSSAQSIEFDQLFAMDQEDGFADTEMIEDGETYAIDLDDLNLSKSIASMNSLNSVGLAAPSLQSQRSDSEMGGEIDLMSETFPAIVKVGVIQEDEDEVDTQTSTDIFGQSPAPQDEQADLTYEENATNTSLMSATIDGDLLLVQQAIEAGANLDRYDWSLGYSPLGMAIDRGHLEIVQCLLAAGANPHSGSTTTTSLGLAAERGEVEIIQMLLPRGIDVNAPVGQGDWTALLSAIKNGHRSAVQLLVTAGANVNVWSRGETPILLAAKCEERDIYHYLHPLVNTAIRLCADRDGEQLLQATRKRRIREQDRSVEKLIEMATIGNIDEVSRAIEIGLEVDEIGAKGHTALMAAAYYGHRAIITHLLEAGADPNLLSDDDGLAPAGMTALMLAAGSFFASNRQQIIKLMIAGGADVNQRGTGGKTAIFYAAMAGAGYIDCVETLIAAGCDLDLQDDRGHTVLSSVAAAENYPMFNLLMQSGAATDGLGSIQLIQAAGAGNTDRVQSLLATKVNLDLDRGAAIGHAAAAGHTKIVELLIKAGANVNLRDQLGFTPIASAAYAGYAEIVQLLIAAGADIQAPASESQSYSALEYAQMGLYQFDRADLQHAQIIQILQQLGAR
jgi:ankyrin repeat protein